MVSSLIHRLLCVFVLFLQIVLQFFDFTIVLPDLVMLLRMFSTWLDDHQQMAKPAQYVPSHPGQLSLAIPSWVGALNVIETTYSGIPKQQDNHLNFG